MSNKHYSTSLGKNGNGDQEYQIIDEGGSKKYFFQIPNMIDDMNLTPIAFRLYSHLKRVAGEDGICWQNTKSLASACRMADGSVTNAKNELLDLKLIEIKEVSSVRGKPGHHIRIVDVWPQNMQQYANTSPSKVINSSDGVINSSGEFNKFTRCNEEEPIKQIPIKKEKEKEEVVVTETLILTREEGTAQADDDVIFSHPKTSLLNDAFITTSGLPKFGIKPKDIKALERMNTAGALPRHVAEAVNALRRKNYKITGASSIENPVYIEMASDAAELENESKDLDDRRRYAREWEQTPQPAAVVWA